MDVAILKCQAMIEVCVRVCVRARICILCTWEGFKPFQLGYFQLQCEDRQTSKKKTWLIWKAMEGVVTDTC